MKPRTKFRNIAANTINMIIAVVRIVPSKASRSILKLRVRKQAAMISAMTTPMEAASVGVATPP
jgi:hypothetical protein